MKPLEPLPSCLPKPWPHHISPWGHLAKPDLTQLGLSCHHCHASFSLVVWVGSGPWCFPSTMNSRVLKGTPNSSYGLLLGPKNMDRPSMLQSDSWAPWKGASMLSSLGSVSWSRVSVLLSCSMLQLLCLLIEFKQLINSLNEKAHVSKLWGYTLWW